jgi:signal transduction histidine kinase
MNRLWIRLSLAFTAVFIVALFIILLTARLADTFIADSELSPPPEVLEYFETVRRERAPLEVTPVALIVGVVAIGAGMWMSRSLTAPLAELEKAAQAIGRQDLGHRVPVRGSQELVAVATAFNEMAGQLQQAEALRRGLLADVAHELRHPVHVLQGNLQAILDDVYPLNKEEIVRLADQTRHLTILVNDLHVLAQADAHQLPLHHKITDIAILVKEAVASFKPLAAAKKVTVQVELLGTMPAAMKLDAARIRQAIHNLLDNGLRHTQDGGAITVSVEQVQDGVQIRVRDTGEGIVPEQLPFIFDRFYRTDKARDRGRGGTGLGLAIVKAIVEAHSGTVTVASPGIGLGSTVAMTLPGAQGTPE